MLEKEKYYSEVGNVKKNILLEAGYILCMIYLFGFTVDYSNINIPYFILLFRILLFGILTIYIHYRNRKGKYYIF